MNHYPVSSTSRADVHVHSLYSDRPSEWVLRRIGSPESFVEPKVVYERAIAAGMNFVTISDHNKIDGALEIADLPGTFISTEITAYFPENQAKVHILALGISESQFDEIQRLRENIYSLRQYFMDQEIVCSVAHPLFLVNDRLTVAQLEKLMVLFNRFELINGTRDPRASQLMGVILDQLTPESVADLATRHGIAPWGSEPHCKHYTAGSDDHSGRYVGSAHTLTPQAADAAEFIQMLRANRHEPAGRSGSSVHLAHCLYQIAYDYYKSRFLKSGRGGSLLSEMFKRLLEPPVSPASGAVGRVRGYIGGWFWNRRKKTLSETEQVLVDEFLLLTKVGDSVKPNGSGPTAAETFEISCRLAHQLGYTFGKRFIAKVREGDLIKSLEAMAALGPVAAAITPYLTAFNTQHKDEKFLQRVAGHFRVDEAMRLRSPAKAWVTDTFDEVNGVAKTIRSLAEAATRKELPLTVLTCLPEQPKGMLDLKNFDPVGRFEVPEYPAQKLSFPPFLQIIEYIERRRFSELVISTPGPLGLTAMLAARLMKLKTTGIYHTDFPNYIRVLTDDSGLEAMTWRYMQWFFNQCDRILVPSQYYSRYLVEHGFSADKISVMRRGIELGRFGPSYRQPGFWKKFGGTDRFTFLYVGRVSSEKNLGVLCDAFERVLAHGTDAQLVIAGDGPMLEPLRRRTGSHSRVIYTGYLEGGELSAAFASGDLFVFPSTTDTFGNVVLEAQASGLPVLVSDRGGPQEVIQPGETGFVLDLSQRQSAADVLAREMIRLADDEDLRSRMGEAALDWAARSSWSSVLNQLWDSGDGKSVPESESLSVV